MGRLDGSPLGGLRVTKEEGEGHVVGHVEADVPHILRAARGQARMSANVQLENGRDKSRGGMLHLVRDELGLGQGWHEGQHQAEHPAR